VIAVLRFGTHRSFAGGRSLRVPEFVPTSTLPVSAACLVANGVRETLSRSLAAEIDVELIEPAVPGAAERRILFDGATIVRVRGRRADAFVIVRRTDARRLVALAFGEHEPPDGAALSAIERATLERIAAGIVPLCVALCGTLGPAVRETTERAASDVATYFEVRTTGAIGVAIGFGLTHDPPQDVTDTIALEDLAAVELEGRVGRRRCARRARVLAHRTGRDDSVRNVPRGTGHVALRRRRVRARRLRSCKRPQRRDGRSDGSGRVSADETNLDMLMNVSLAVTAELGRCTMRVSDVLKIGRGTIVELDRLAGAPIDVLVNARLVARGEVVAVDDRFGVRVTEVVSRRAGR